MGNKKNISEKISCVKLTLTLIIFLIVSPLVIFSQQINESMKKKIIEQNIDIAKKAVENRDAIVKELTNLASYAQQYYRKPPVFGGGGNSFKGWTVPSQLVSTTNGKYSTIVAKESVKLIGIGKIKGQDNKNKVKITMVIDSESIVSTTINN